MNDRRPQTLGALLSSSFALLRQHLRLVLAVTLPVVAFVDVVIAAGLGELTASPNKVLPVADDYIVLSSSLLVTVPLVTAMLARVIVVSRAGEARPRARDIAIAGSELFAPAFVVLLMFWASVFVGFALLLAPGIYMFVSWWFVVQAVAIDRSRGTAAIVRSASLVRGHWWRTAGMGVGVVLLTAIPGSLISAAFESLAVAVNSDVPAVIGSIVIDTITLPFIAIAATLYYLELRELAGLPAPR